MISEECEGHNDSVVVGGCLFFGFLNKLRTLSPTCKEKEEERIVIIDMCLHLIFLRN